jgi:putative transposase
MRTSRFTDEQIIGIVREYEAGAKLDGALPPTRHLADDLLQVARQVRRDGGLGRQAAEGARGGERRLKRLLADTMLDNQASRGCWQKTGDACGAAAGGGERPTGAWALTPSCLQAGRDLALGGGAHARA